MNAKGLALVKSFEGFRGSPYRDPVGILTIGYGHVLPLTEAEAAYLLEYKLRPYEQAVLDAVDVPLGLNQIAALTSFAYNVGITAFRRSTLLRKLNEGDYEAVPKELARWNKAKGKVLAGLIRRRAAEARLWDT